MEPREPIEPAVRRATDPRTNPTLSANMESAPPALIRGDSMAQAGPAPRPRARGVALLLVFAACVPLPIRAEEVDEEQRQLIETLRAVEAAEKQRDAERRQARFEASDEGAIERVLDSTRIDLDFTDASLEDIIGFIREYAKVNIEIDQKVREEGLAEKKVSVVRRDAVLATVLDDLLREYDLEYIFDHKVLLIIRPPGPPSEANLLSPLDAAWTPSDPPAVDPSDPDGRLREWVRTEPVTICCSGKFPLTDMLGEFSRRTGIPIVVDTAAAAALAGKVVCYRADGLPLAASLDLLSKMIDVRLTWCVKGGSVVLVSPEVAATRMKSTAWDGIPPRDGLTALGKNAQGYEEFRQERTGIVLVKLPAGEYRTGGAREDILGEEPAIGHVTIERPFLLGKTEVTNAQFRRFADRRWYLEGHHSGKVGEADLDGNDQPAVMLGFEEMAAFCDWAGLRFPSEPEWEYAARAGDDRMFPWGDSWPPPADAGTYAASKGTTTVMSHAANPFGLFDLGGSAWEVCAGRPQGTPWGYCCEPFDRWGKANPALRGGSWLDARPSRLQCSRQVPFSVAPSVGFRVALDWKE